MKQTLRQDLLQKRQNMAGKDVANTEITKRVLRHITDTSKSVAAYYPFKGEVDILPSLNHLHINGHQTALPVITAKASPLSFKTWKLGDALTESFFKIPQPTQNANDILPDIILIPLVGFDRSGNRLGYGGGFYDRTLETLRATKPVIAIGIAFSIQEVDKLAPCEHDEPLDYIITEREIITCASSS